MASDKSLTRPAVRLGDAAAVGLIHGLVAGAVMTAYLLAVALLSGESMAAMLARFDGAGAVSAQRGALLHLAVSGVYGMGFAILWRLVDRRRSVAGLPAGLAYGILLFLVAELILLPGAGSPLRDIPALHLGIAHVAYGLVLGALGGRNAAVTARR